MTKAVNELGLEWSPPEEPSRSRLDKWFLPGRHQALRQRSSPFFPEVHNELTKLWRASYSSRIRPSASVALTSIDSAEDKVSEHLPLLDESVAAHLCPPTAIGWKTMANHRSKPCRAIGEQRCGNSIFMRHQENESPTSSYSSTLGLTNCTNGPKRAPV